VSARGAHRPLWTCPECGQTFVIRNASHSCVKLTLDEFFGDRSIHQFRLTNVDELDDEVASWLRDAYRVGLQEA
jgi:hypothetical protein